MVWAAAIAVVDWRSRRVPNLLLLALLLPAITVLAWRSRGLLGEEWLSSLGGMACGFALALPGHLASRLGAGDVKLAAVIGFVAGLPLLFWSLLAAGLMLGAMSLAVVWMMGLANARGVRLPAAVALAGGFSAAVVARTGGWA